MSDQLERRINHHRDETGRQLSATLRTLATRIDEALAAIDDGRRVESLAHPNVFMFTGLLARWNLIADLTPFALNRPPDEETHG